MPIQEHAKAGIANTANAQELRIQKMPIQELPRQGLQNSSCKHGDFKLTAAVELLLS